MQQLGTLNVNVNNQFKHIKYTNFYNDFFGKEVHNKTKCCINKFCFLGQTNSQKNPEKKHRIPMYISSSTYF